MYIPPTFIGAIVPVDCAEAGGMMEAVSLVGIGNILLFAWHWFCILCGVIAVIALIPVAIQTWEEHRRAVRIRENKIAMLPNCLEAIRSDVHAVDDRVDRIASDARVRLEALEAQIREFSKIMDSIYARD